MTYSETLDFLFTQTPMFQNSGAGAYKPGLDTTLALARAWGDPHRQLRAIHIGGTNGKGSTAHTLAAVLQSAGYKTGLYTSPHLVDFRERIRIDGEMISQSEVVDFVERFLADDSLKNLSPSFFELTTIMAFDHFVRSGVDVAVVEVGLGGRLDCTNILSPELSVITNISLDHTALLGDSEEAIAAEKAGIIKAATPVVISEADGSVRTVFEKKAAEANAPIVFASDFRMFSKAAGCPEGGIDYYDTPWGTVHAQLDGSCQVKNTAGLLCALRILAERFPRINADAVRAGFASVCQLTGLAGRWMKHTTTSGLKVVCDTGHNIGGWRYLGPALSEIASKGNLHVIIGFVNDKDADAILRQMPASARYYFTCPSVSRGRSAESTAAAAREAGLTGTVCVDVAEAVAKATSEASAGDTIFIGGSTFIVADYLAIPDRP